MLGLRGIVLELVKDHLVAKISQEIIGQVIALKRRVMVGGRIKGSSPRLREFSTMTGIILESRGQLI